MSSKVAPSRAQNKRKTAITAGESEEVVFMAHDPNDILEEYLVSKPKSRKSRRRRKKKNRNSICEDAVSNFEENNANEKEEKRNRKSDGNEQRIYIDEEELRLSRRMSRKMSAPSSPDFTPLLRRRLSFSNTENSPSFNLPESPDEP